jgi:hypothetical protein
MNEELEAIKASDVVQTVAKLSKWKDYVLYLLLFVVAVEGVVILWNRGTINDYETKALTAKVELDKVKLARDQAIANESICHAKMSEQNAIIDKEGKKFQNIQKDFSDLAKTLAELQARYNKDVTNVMNQPTPKTCADINSFINRNLP